LALEELLDCVPDLLLFDRGQGDLQTRDRTVLRVTIVVESAFPCLIGVSAFLGFLVAQKA